jgi:hypothetical protein
MKKHWLRGVLLGVSLALLLSGGVALAQRAMTFTVDQYCMECCPEGVCTGFGPEVVVPPEGYRLDLAFSDLNLGAGLCQRMHFESGGDTYDIYISFGQLVASSCDFSFWLTCDQEVGLDTDCVDLFSSAIEEVGTKDITDWHGQWDWWVWQAAECANEPPESAEHFTFVLADDCTPAEEEEFVPELGTIMLLGSGLAGLAGYATLRWRTKE